MENRTALKKGIPQALPIVITSDSSLLRFLHSYQQMYSLHDVSPSKFPGPVRTKIIEENADKIKKTGRRKA